MAYNGGITKAKSVGSFGNKGQTNQQNSIDRFVEVTGYDLGKKVMFAKDCENGKEYEVYINEETYLRSEARNKQKNVDLKNINWQGHNIDERMKKGNPEGSKVSLLRSKVIKKDAGNGKSLLEAHWVGGVPNPEPDKAFTSVVSVNYKIKDGKKRLNKVFVWQQKGIDINDEIAIGKLKDEIDAQLDLNQKLIKGAKGEYKTTVPTIGVQLVSLMKTDKKYLDGGPVYDVVDKSTLFYWIPGPDDEEGNRIKSQDHNLSGEEMLAYAGGYVEHISGHDAFKDHIDDMKIEIRPFRVYPASENDSNLLSTNNPENDDKNPLYQMAHRRNFLDLEQTEDIEGMNAGVKGIVLCGPNKTDKVNGVLTEIPQYWVSKIHANNIRGDVHAFIRTSEGYKTEVRPEITLIKPEKNQSTTKVYSEPKSTQQEYSHHEEDRHESAASSSRSEPTMPDLDDPFDDDFNPLNDAPPVQQAAAPRPGFKFGAKKED